jgi:hypothetical protein
VARNGRDTCTVCIPQQDPCRGIREFLGWAGDFPAEAAADAVRVLAGRNQSGAARTRRARPHFDEEFVDRYVPEWSDLIARVLERE